MNDTGDEYYILYNRHIIYLMSFFDLNVISIISVN